MVSGRERLQKILSRAGVASRRKAEEFITAGRVTVNGKVASELGVKADPQKDLILLDGKILKPPEPNIYVLLYKPRGYICTTYDPEGRRTVLDLVRKTSENLYPVGRLDYQTEGILLLTNDGQFANMLCHPRFKVPKVYRVKVRGVPDEKTIKRILKGVRIEKEIFRASKVSVMESVGKNVWLSVELTEGKNRELRVLFDYLRHPVSKIKRVRYGFLTLSDLKPGEYRYLERPEVNKLYKLAGKKK